MTAPANSLAATFRAAAPRPSAAASSPWLACFRPVSAPLLRVFCLPYAGAGASAYRGWALGAPADVEVHAVQLPGRETRVREACLDDVAQAVPPLAEAMAPLLDGPFVIFGHSMGAALAHDLGRHLITAGHMPALMVFSGRRAPHLPPRKAPVHHLPDAQFKDALRAMGGTPPEVLGHAELMAFLLPMLKADFRMSETFTRAAEAAFPCPVLSVAGSRDAEAAPEDVARWQDLAAGRFSHHVFDDGHFFLHPHREALMDLILTEALPVRP